MKKIVISAVLTAIALTSTTSAIAQNAYREQSANPSRRAQQAEGRASSYGATAAYNEESANAARRREQGRYDYNSRASVAFGFGIPSGYQTYGPYTDYNTGQPVFVVKFPKPRRGTPCFDAHGVLYVLDRDLVPRRAEGSQPINTDGKAIKVTCGNATFEAQ